MVHKGMKIDDATIAAFCHRRRIHRLALFGSVLREDFRPESDVDILVEYEPDAGVGYIQMGEMESELTAIIGRRVELHTAGDLSAYFRDQVVGEAQTLYVAA